MTQPDANALRLLPADMAEACERFPSALSSCVNLDALNRLKGTYTGREGSLSARLMESLKKAPKEQKRDLGAVINGLKKTWEEALKARQIELETEKKHLDSAKNPWDATLPPPMPPAGALHPLNRLMDRLVDVFRPLGYHVEEGPEVETEAHNFDGLNIPEDHSARGTADTFYLALHSEQLLRTHTSPVQVRVLKRLAPELETRGGIRFLAPGRVYRKDEIDPTHSPMFHQVEGMLVGKGIGMHHLKGTLAYAMKALFGPDADVRFRPSYFPFVEPGCEMDVHCPLCLIQGGPPGANGASASPLGPPPPDQAKPDQEAGGGSGCRVCKGSGWVEILGAGLIHPNVLRVAGIDPEIWSGFAFGMGVERTAMMVSQTPDLRLFFENDQRFLKSMGGLD